MAISSIALTIALAGGFATGALFTMARSGSSKYVNPQGGMSAEGILTESQSVGFGKAKQNFDNKIAALEDIRRRRSRIDQLFSEEEYEIKRKQDLADQRADLRKKEEEERIAEEEAERRRREELEEAERRRIEREEEEARLEEERRAEEARLEEERRAEEERLLEEQRLEEQRRLDEAERLRLEEEARLAEERERERQEALAAAEAERLAEIEAAREAAALESRRAAEKAMSELQARLAREGAKSSDVQISLMWNNYNDLDLHVVCPSGERIHGGNKISQCLGELDVDANVRGETRKPVENVVWPEGKAPAGRYQVYVHHYKKHDKRRSKDPTKFQVIVNGGGDLQEFNGELSSGDPILLVAEFDLEAPEIREQRRKALEAEIRRAQGLEPLDDDVDPSILEPQQPEVVDLAETANQERESLDEQAEREGQEVAALHQQRMDEQMMRQEQELSDRVANQKVKSELEQRLKREGAKSSDVQISLMWNNYNDLDLHVLSPSGERIHNGNRTSSCGGQLDVDANENAESRKPVENIFWPEGRAPPGKYQVFVHYYKKHKKRRSKDPTAFQIIAQFAGESYEYSGELTYGDPILKVCEFILDSEEERQQKISHIQNEIESMDESETAHEEHVEDEQDEGDVDTNIPSAPDLDAAEEEEFDDADEDDSGDNTSIELPPAPDLDEDDEDDVPSAPDLDE
jgi:uncharacterized protein YfaP (DUF2135 family)